MTEEESKTQMHYLLDQAYQEAKEGQSVVGVFVNLVIRYMEEYHAIQIKNIKK